MPINHAARSEALKHFKKLDPDAMAFDDDVTSISTGSIAVDVITGIGGFPRGRLSEVHGMESSGKTTLCIQACAAAQLEGLYPAYFDLECALDLRHAERLGFEFRDREKGLLVSPRTAEDALTMTEELIQAGADLVVIDSIPGLVPKAELEGDISDAPLPAVRARLLATAIPRLTNLVRQSKTALVVVNQLRSTMAAQGFGGARAEHTAGGYALKYFASLRMSLRQVRKSHQTRKVVDFVGVEREVPVTAKHEAEIVKSKVASPYRKIDFLIRFDEATGIYGIDNLITLIDIGKVQKIITVKTSWIEYLSIKENGDQNFYHALRNAPDVMAKLRGEIVALGLLKS